jgi:ABC-type nitrate/sulfonate/bicarbonate transport system substrate-binding protein
MANRAKPTGNQTESRKSYRGRLGTRSAEGLAAGVADAPGASGDTPALPGAGISEPAQLAGRRLGLPQRDERLAVDVRRAAASRGFHSATALACLFCDEYDYVELAVARDDAGPAVPYAAEAAALLRGEVDAIYVAGTAGRALARDIGAVEVVDLGAHLDPMVRVNATTPVALTVDAETLQREPGPVARLLAARRAVDLSAQSLEALGAQKDWLLRNGFLAADVDVAAWVDAGPLAAARSLRAGF